MFDHESHLGFFFASLVAPAFPSMPTTSIFATSIFEDLSIQRSSNSTFQQLGDQATQLPYISTAQHLPDLATQRCRPLPTAVHPMDHHPGP